MSRTKSAAAAGAERLDWHAAWEARKATFVASIWRQMCQVPYRYFAYYTPSSGASWGEFYAVAEGLAAPAGAQLIAAEPIPCGTRQQIASWLERHAQRLPMLPTEGAYGWIGTPRASTTRGAQ